MNMSIIKSGLSSARVGMNAISQNIANLNTFGYKRQDYRPASFLMANSGLVSSFVNSGGVMSNPMTYSFEPGSYRESKNILDVSIQGDGFFTIMNSSSTSEDGNLEYTRSGAFKLNKDRELVNFMDDSVMSYPVDEDGVTADNDVGALEKVVIPDEIGDPEPTTDVNMSINLDNSNTVEPKLADAFNPKNPDSYHYSLESTVFDEVGNKNILRSYFVKPAINRSIDGNKTVVDASFDSFTQGSASPDGADAPDAFDNKSVFLVFYEMNGRPVNPDGDFPSWNIGHKKEDGTAINFKFTQDDYPLSEVTSQKWPASAMFFDKGSYDTVLPSAPINLKTSSVEGLNLNDVNMNYQGSTAYAAKNELISNESNGSGVTSLESFSIDNSGLIAATYSNGVNKNIARLAIARFPGMHNLKSIGKSSWAETEKSGKAEFGQANSDNFGLFKSGFIELSNVDQSEAVIKLLEQQSRIQAIAKTLNVSLENSRSINKAFD